MSGESVSERAAMPGRLLRAVDFERVLRTRSRSQSAHFALHHLGERPSRPAKPATKRVETVLSTDAARSASMPVDDLPASTLPEVRPAQGSIWLGAVIPKRHAKRSVTRNLLKRQIRAVVGIRCASLPGGLWVVRLRAPFDRQQFVSAASDALRRTARDELEQLLTSAAQRLVGA